METLKVLELFGGIGACTEAMKNIGLDFKVVDYVEFDKYPVKSYNAINNFNFEIQDITEWDKDIDVDFVMHGSPCQDFSLSGYQNGGDEGSKTRSSLMWETVRILKKIKPKYVCWENVKNVLSEKHKHNFDKYLKELDELGYNNYYQILDAQNYGTPQHRERIIVVSIRKDIDDKTFKFPDKQPLTKNLFDLMEDDVDEKYYLSAEQIQRMKETSYHSSTYKYRVQGVVANTLCARDYKDPKCIQIADLNHYKNDQMNRIYSPDGISPTLTTVSGGGRQIKVIDDNRVRKLTPREYWRLQGFSDESFNKAAQVNSSSQLYKQAGNSICVSLLEAVFCNLFSNIIK